jgi:flagellar motor switch protein FliN/FliY
MPDDQLMDQDDIERLLNAGKGQAASASPPQPADAAAQTLTQGEIESPLTQAGAAGGTAGHSQTPQAAPAQATSAAHPEQAPHGAHVPAEEGTPLAQDSVEKLLEQAGQALAKPSAQPAATKHALSEAVVGEGTLLPADVDYLLRQAEEALESVNTAAAGDLPQGVSPFRLEEFAGAPACTESATFDLIRDVELDLRIELGHTHMYLEDVLKLRKGSVVPLDKLAGDPVDVYVNGRLIARGEVLVLSDNFCVRVAELIAGTNASA